MTPRLANPLASVSRSIASGDSAKIAADHLRRGLAIARFIDMESAEPDTYSVTPSRLIIGSLAGNEKGDVSPTVGIKWTYLTRAADITRRGNRQQARLFPIHSRIDRAHFPFATAIANLGATRRSSQLDRLAFGLAGPFGKLAGKGVGAPFSRIFKVSPSNTIRLAAPMLSNSEFAA